MAYRSKENHDQGFLPFYPHYSLTMRAMALIVPCPSEHRYSSSLLFQRETPAGVTALWGAVECMETVKLEYQTCTLAAQRTCTNT